MSSIRNKLAVASLAFAVASVGSNAERLSYETEAATEYPDSQTQVDLLDSAEVFDEFKIVFAISSLACVGAFLANEKIQNNRLAQNLTQSSDIDVTSNM